MGTKKNRRKVSRRFKRQVRKTVAALFMITAIAVAAIPVTPMEAEENGNGAQNETPVVYEKTEYTYPSETELSKEMSELTKAFYVEFQKDYPGETLVKPTDTSKIFTTSYITQDSTSGFYQIMPQFQCYNINKFDGSGYDNIICGYSANNAVDILNIYQNMHADYIVIKQSKIDSFLEGEYCRKGHNLTAEEIANGVALDPTEGYYYVQIDYDGWNGTGKYAQNKSTCQKYGNEENWLKFSNTCQAYKDAVKAYENGNSNQQPIKPTDIFYFSFADIDPTVVGDATKFCMYYCEKNAITGFDYLQGCTLVKAKDFTGNILNPGETVASDVYVVKKMNEPYGQKLSEYGSLATDEIGFVYQKAVRIVGIGDGAFQGVKNIRNVVLDNNIKYIGQNAFEDNNIQSFVFDSDVTYIGNRAFNKTPNLRSIELPDDLQTIGVEAFYSSNLESLTLPRGITKIGTGAFANSRKLLTIDFTPMTNSNSELGCDVGEAAFFDATALNEVKFFDNTNVSARVKSLGKACFGVSTTPTGTLSQFTLPSFISTENGLGGCLFYNRTSIKKIIMPQEFGNASQVHLNDDFLVGLKELECIEIPEASSGDIDYTTQGSNALLRDVQTENFYIRGPARNKQGTLPKARECTNMAFLMSANDKPVPYIFSEGGIEQFEVSNTTRGKYVLSISKEGVLKGCKYNTGYNSENITPDKFVIPAKVGDYKVTSIQKGCFDNVKNNISSLTINDDSILELDDDIFKGASELTEVFIGNSVVKIGASAFENCPKLENVYFRTPSGGYEAMTIGSKAFATNSQKLYFHGDINEKYAPFVYAMANENWVSTTNTKNMVSICYKSDYAKNDTPSYLVVLKERYTDSEGAVSTKACLVDYLHYEEIPGLPSDMFSRDLDIAYTNWPMVVYQYENGEGISIKEEEVINASLKPRVDSGIVSIDVKEFLTNGLNGGNIVTYLNSSVGYDTSSPTSDTYYRKFEYAGYPIYKMEGNKQYHLMFKNLEGTILQPSAAAEYFTAGTKITAALKSNYNYNKGEWVFDENGTETPIENSSLTTSFYKWRATVENSHFSLGTDVTNSQKLEFDMPAGDTQIEAIFQPTISYSVTQNNHNSSISVKQIIVDKKTGYRYNFVGWEMIVYKQDGSSDSNIQEQYQEDFNAVRTKYTISFGVKGGESNPDIEIKDATHSLLFKARYEITDSLTKGNFVSVMTAAKKTPGVAVPDYFYNYSEYGLFNGFYGFEDSNNSYMYSAREYDSASIDASKELEDIGNDFITKITMTSVKQIPDHAFLSCENLEEIDLGTSVESMGEAPFKGCTSLTGLKSQGKYLCQNGILYIDNGDGTYDIVECLPRRGDGVGASEYPTADDIDVSKVKSLNPGAFEGCSNLIKVDLTNASLLTEIPKDCFNDCAKLRNVILPRNISQIDVGAFKGDERTIVTIPRQTLEIVDEAFGTGDTIRSYANGSGYYYTQKFKDVEFEVIDETFRVDFYDWDGKALRDPQYVEPGKSATPPEKDPVREGYTFKGWSGEYNNIQKDTVLLAQYEPYNAAEDPANQYHLKVNGGVGDGTYATGTKIIITADSPLEGYEFDKWTTTSTDHGIADASAYLTTIVMPAHDLEMKATYKKSTTSTNGSTSNGTNNNNSSSNNNNSNNNNSNNNNSNNNNSNNNNSNSNNSNSNSNNNNSNSSGNKGSSNNTSNSGSSGSNSNSSASGTKVDVNKPGISNTGLSSATVNGSTDNFIVKVTESSAATEAVRQALVNEYGSLEDIAYLAMDISLYDSTGTTKITDTTGLSVTITLPIPDALRSYAGNNKAAGVVDSVNGKALDKLSTKFSTIDGVPCITFTATHFSPYTIYVDTKHLSNKTYLDDNPKTGDGIHPKWFLSIALAATSIFLFLKKDKKKTRALA